MTGGEGSGEEGGKKREEFGNNYRAEGALTEEREMPTTAKSVVITRRIHK